MLRAVCATCLVGALACGDSGEPAAERGDPPSQRDDAAPTEPAYPDSPEGLETLVQELLDAGDDPERAATLAASLELGDHEAWFRAAFGEETGDALAEEYAPTVGQFAGMATLVGELGGNGYTEIEVERFEEADDPASVGYQSLALEKMEDPTPLYSVRLHEQDGDGVFHLWSFVYADGRFRWVGKMKALGKPKMAGDVDTRELRLRDAEALADNN